MLPLHSQIPVNLIAAKAKHSERKVHPGVGEAARHLSNVPGEGVSRDIYCVPANRTASRLLHIGLVAQAHLLDHYVRHLVDQGGGRGALSQPCEVSRPPGGQADCEVLQWNA